MGITRDSVHKRRATSGKQKAWRKKRNFEIGRPAAMTHLGGVRIHPVRCRGGMIKHRALRLESGNFSWGTEVTTHKCRIINVVYNASNNELVRTKTLVKGAIVEIDSSPFASWYEKHYGVTIGKQKQVKAVKGQKQEEKKEEVEKVSHRVLQKREQRYKGVSLDQSLADQFQQGRLYARISSRPGQTGRADGYILEGPELDFYVKKLSKKKSSK